MFNGVCRSREEELLTGDGGEDRDGEWERVVSPPDCHSGAGICQYKNTQKVGPIYP